MLVAAIVLATRGGDRPEPRFALDESCDARLPFDLLPPPGFAYLPAPEDSLDDAEDLFEGLRGFGRDDVEARRVVRGRRVVGVALSARGPTAGDRDEYFSDLDRDAREDARSEGVHFERTRVTGRRALLLEGDIDGARGTAVLTMRGCRLLLAFAERERDARRVAAMLSSAD